MSTKTLSVMCTFQNLTKLFSRKQGNSQMNSILQAACINIKVLQCLDSEEHNAWQSIILKAQFAAIELQLSRCCYRLKQIKSVLLLEYFSRSDCQVNEMRLELQPTFNFPTMILYHNIHNPSFDYHLLSVSLFEF